MTTMPPVPQTAAAPLATTGPSSPDVSSPNGETVFWLRKPGAKKRQTILIQGGRIQSNWLQQRLHVTQVRFQGPLAQALTDLQQASKKSKENK